MFDYLKRRSTNRFQQNFGCEKLASAQEYRFISVASQDSTTSTNDLSNPLKQSLLLDNLDR